MSQNKIADSNHKQYIKPVTQTSHNEIRATTNKAYINLVRKTVLKYRKMCTYILEIQAQTEFQKP